MKDTTTDYYALRADTIGDAIFQVEQHNHAELVAMIVNSHINDWVAEHCDGGERFESLRGLFDNVHGKLIPYHGWYWRSTDWAKGDITIAYDGTFVGVCENNKWGWDQRQLTPEEAAQVTELVWKAMRADDDHNVETAEVVKILSELRALFQTFTIPSSPWNR